MATKDGKVFTKAEKAIDLEVHVRYRKVEDEEFVDIRDFVPSTKTYGRGILIPLDDGAVTTVINGLGAVDEAVNG